MISNRYVRDKFISNRFIRNALLPYRHMAAAKNGAERITEESSELREKARQAVLTAMKAYKENMK